MPQCVAADLLHHGKNISALCASSMQLLQSIKTEECDFIVLQKADEDSYSVDLPNSVPSGLQIMRFTEILGSLTRAA